MKKYIAECLGTFALSLVVVLTLYRGFPVPTPVVAALTLGLFVYTIGSISGTHINPAVTIGAWSIGKISNKDAGLYIVAQCIGALVAFGMFYLFFGQMPHPAFTGATSFAIMCAELIGTFFFTFGIASVIYGKIPQNFSGVLVGGSLLLGIAVAVPLGAAGFLNPAVALAAHSFGWMYIVGPILGSLLGMQAYKHLAGSAR